MKVKNDTTPVSLSCESLMDIAGELAHGLRRSIVRVIVDEDHLPIYER
jgi:hypothetical protein